MALLTPAQKDIVQKSWKNVVDRDMLESTGVRMFTRLFSQHPELLCLFPFGDLGLPMDELKHHAKFVYHAGRVIKTVGTGVDGLDDLGTVVKKLESLGKRHRKYNVKPEYFKAVGEALIFSLSNSESFDGDHEVAWQVLFDFFADKMKSGLL